MIIFLEKEKNIFSLNCQNISKAIGMQLIFNLWLKLQKGFFLSNMATFVGTDTSILITSLVGLFICMPRGKNWKRRHLSWIVLNFVQNIINPLSTNPTKWSNALKQIVGCCRQIVWVYLIILWSWRSYNWLKQLSYNWTSHCQLSLRRDLFLPNVTIFSAEYSVYFDLPLGWDSVHVYHDIITAKKGICPNLSKC